jgi:hypothetical protein
MSKDTFSTGSCTLPTWCVSRASSADRGAGLARSKLADSADPPVAEGRIDAPMACRAPSGFGGTTPLISVANATKTNWCPRLRSKVLDSWSMRTRSSFPWLWISMTATTLGSISSISPRRTPARSTTWSFDYFLPPLCLGRCARADPAADFPFLPSPLAFSVLPAACPAFFPVVMNRSLKVSHKHTSSV